MDLQLFKAIGCVAVASILVVGCSDKKESQSSDVSSKSLGALWGFVGAAQAKSDATLMAQKGRNIFVAIIQANFERESMGIASVWPKSGSDKDDDAKNIAGMDFHNSAKFFEELFDLKNNGTDDYRPYVRGLDLACLSGGGVPTAGGNVKSLEGKYVAWSVLKGLRDEMQDIIPVLVSANVNVHDLIISGDFDGKSKKKVGIGTDAGAEKDLFGNKFFVIVRKSGSAEIFDAESATLEQIYKKTPFSIPPDAILQYLVP